MPQIAGFRGVLSTATPERDGARSVYRYHQIFAGPGSRTFTRKNLLVAVRLSPWDEGMIRPHELATTAGRDAVLARIKSSKAHAEPVVMGLRDPSDEVERLLRRLEGGRPALERTTPDGVIHRVWRSSDAELIGKLRNYLAQKKLHVLEGHDRYEAMLAYQAEVAGASPTYSSANYGLACIVAMSDPTLVTAPRHRILRGTLDREKVLATARTHFLVEPLPGAAGDVGKLLGALGQTIAHQPTFVAVFAGSPDAYKLTLSPDVSPFSEGVAPHRGLQKLDPVVVDGLFVARAAAGTTITTATDPAAALAALADGAAAVLFVRPLSIEQIAHVDELGQLLPAGSTALHPAIADDLVRLPIDPDEDLV